VLLYKSGRKHMRHKEEYLLEETKIIKRKGRIEEYDGTKIIVAVKNASHDCKKGDDNLPYIVEEEVYENVNGYVRIEEIQDLVEESLMKHNKHVAKEYILYRERHRKLREESTKDHYLDLVDSYLEQSTWRTKENSNAHYSYGALNKFITEMVSKDYWMNRVYPENIKQASESGEFHIHDLGGLTVYCCGYSLKDLINKGVRGISNIPTSSPAKHFASILNQLANITTIFQNEIMGAVAFSNFDTLLAPFVKADGLEYDEIYQQVQNFIFSINSNSRGGAEPAFSNITIDLSPDKDMANRKAIIAGKEMDFTYSECQEEIDLINKALWNIMYNGDSTGAQFAYPIPTINIHDEFKWDNPENDILWKLTGKFGTPYFANFINTDMNPEDARSMCCRLRLSIREIKKKTGGLFGAGEKTGSIGVVTLNMPRYGYLASTEEELFELIERYMNLAKDSLEIKREFLQDQLDRGLLPAFKEYVGHLEAHFSTIGYLGLNEMCVNFLGEDILSQRGYELAEKVLDFMNVKIADYQEETDNLWNLEASPSESTCYKLALKDNKLFGNDIFSQGMDGERYYTNSCHVPVNKLTTIDDLYKHQHKLQSKHSGGTVIHNWLKGGISGDKAKKIIKYTAENYEAPYTSLSPVYSICPEHGYVQGYQEQCPICDRDIISYQRITGYTRPVNKFNAGKEQEFKDRNQMRGDM